MSELVYTLKGHQWKLITRAKALKERIEKITSYWELIHHFLDDCEKEQSQLKRLTTNIFRSNTRDDLKECEEYLLKLEDSVWFIERKGKNYTHNQ